MLLFVSLILVASAFGQTTVNHAVQEIQHKIHQEVTALFQGADINHNGGFDKGDMASLFTTYDTSPKDGSVTKLEFVSVFTAHAHELRTVANGLFVELDMDSNGSITDHDLTLFFDKLDTNDDGSVSKHEFVEYFTQATRSGDGKTDICDSKTSINVRKCSSPPYLYSVSTIQQHNNLQCNNLQYNHQQYNHQQYNSKQYNHQQYNQPQKCSLKLKASVY